MPGERVRERCAESGRLVFKGWGWGRHPGGLVENGLEGGGRMQESRRDGGNGVTRPLIVAPKRPLARHGHPWLSQRLIFQGVF